jgi:precorrin-3B C17-methyltransferase
MSAAAGRVSVIGLGPGLAEWITPETRRILDGATDLIGYAPYLKRAGVRPDQRIHASDNRQELERAAHALDLARDGAAVAVVSGGDPGIFAMAAAVFEALDGQSDGRWDGVSVTVHPGITAAQALAARIGAPLGNDFCIMSLSDNLKPWDLIVRRLRLAAEADFVIALYNPISKARPWQLGAAFDVLRGIHSGTTPVALGRAVGRAEEEILLTDLVTVDPTDADMSTVVVIGASTSKTIQRHGYGTALYTPRYHPGVTA